MVDAGMNYVTGRTCEWQHILAVGMDNPACGKAICDTSHNEEVRLDGEVLIPARSGSLPDAQFIAHAREDIPYLLELLAQAAEVLRYYGDVEVIEFDWGLSAREFLARMEGEKSAP